MRLADKLLLCAAGIYTVLQCARILDVFYAWFFMEYFFVGVFLLLAAVEYCKLLCAYFKKKQKDKEIKSELKGEKL